MLLPLEVAIGMGNFPLLGVTLASRSSETSNVPLATMLLPLTAAFRLLGGAFVIALLSQFLFDSGCFGLVPLAIALLPKNLATYASSRGARDVNQYEVYRKETQELPQVKGGVDP